MKEKYTFKGTCGAKTLLAIPYGEKCLKTGNSMFKWFPNEDGEFMCEHECMILDAVSGISGVAKKLDCGIIRIDNGHSVVSYPAIETSFLKGKTLDRIWNSKQKEDFELSALLNFCKEVLGTLAQIQERGLIHNDLSPYNIIKTNDEDKNYVVIDWGSALWLDAPVEEQFIRGTSEYIAPEKKEGIITPASDVFSFGVLLKKFYERGELLGEKYPKELKPIISRATNENPAERYQSFDELIEAITAFEQRLQEKEDKKEEHADETEDVCFKQEDDISTTALHPRSFDWAIGIYRFFTALFLIGAVFFFSLGMYILVRPDDGTPLLVNGHPSIKQDIEIVYNDIKRARL